MRCGSVSGSSAGVPFAAVGSGLFRGFDDDGYFERLVVPCECGGGEDWGLGMKWMHVLPMQARRIMPPVIDRICFLAQR